MTIADKLTRLSTAHDAIISAINAKGGSATGDGFEDFAADIAAIPGGGGGSSYTLIHSEEFQLTYSSTTAATATTIALGSSGWFANAVLYVKVRDKAGRRNGYFLGTDSYIMNYQAANNAASNLTAGSGLVHSQKSDGTVNTVSGSMSSLQGLYPYSLAADGTLTMRKRYNASNTLTIDSTYIIEIYKLDYAPNQGDPYTYGAVV